MKYARYLVEYLSDILLHLRNPLRKAAFFGAIFNKVPNYDNLVGRTHENSPLPEVNELFRVTVGKNPFLVTSRGIEPRLQG